MRGPGAGRSVVAGDGMSRGWLGAAAAALAVQLAVVYAPSAPAGPEVSGLDKVVHVAVFAAPAFAGLRAGLPARWVLLGLAAHAPISEVLQALVLPHRDGDLGDTLADLAGVALGWLAARSRPGRSGRSGPRIAGSHGNAADRTALGPDDVSRE